MLEIKILFRFAFVHLLLLYQKLDSVEQSELLLGAQDMNAAASGAYTGEISAEMLRDLYVSFVILGHSERRQYFSETNQVINKKFKPQLRRNLKPIYCVERLWRSESKKL